MQQTGLHSSVSPCGSPSLPLRTVGDVLRGDDHGAGRVRDTDGLPAEQLQGAAAAVHGSGVCLLHRSGGRAHTQYVSQTPTQTIIWLEFGGHKEVTKPVQ